MAPSSYTCGLLFRRGKEDYVFVSSMQEIHDILAADHEAGPVKHNSTGKKSLESGTVAKSESAYSLSHSQSTTCSDTLFYLYLKEDQVSPLRHRDFAARDVSPDDLIATLDDTMQQEKVSKRVSIFAQLI
jgi:hypothetical protein